MSKIINKSCDWNPRNLPITKIGTCQNSEHYDITEQKKRGQKVRLWMFYSDEYNKWMDSPREKLSDEDFDKQFDEIEKKKWQSGTEKYYCEECCEASME